MDGKVAHSFTPKFDSTLILHSNTPLHRIHSALNKDEISSFSSSQRQSQDTQNLYPLSCVLMYTVSFLNIRTPKKLAVISLKFEQDGFTKE